MSFDFDQMAKDFSRLRSSYMSYKQGQSKHEAEKALNHYIKLSERFFSAYPNPFADHDQDFVRPIRETTSRSSYKSLNLKLQRLMAVREVINTKIESIDDKNISKLEKYRNFLSDCEQKISEVKFLIQQIETSRLPG